MLCTSSASRRALALAVGAAFLPVALAQVAPPAAAPAASAPVQRLAPVVVTGNPLGSNDIVAPVTVLQGDELVLRRGSSLGETLNGLTGVSTTHFGPNASRPIVRGLDGDRVRILSNSGASFDASSLSFDHAVPIDPLVVERIEVLRGPGALLYGGSAIGGVVNAIDNRVPKYALDGASGSGEVRFGGADRERGGGAVVEAGNGRFALHADAFGRRTSDREVPRYTPVEADGTLLDATRRIRNSAARTEGGALGGAWTFGTGYLGIAADTYDSRYGVVAEPDTAIHMKRDHVVLAGEARDLGGGWRTIRAQVNDTRYRHDEIEGGGVIGTTFRTAGTEVRVEAEHAPLGPVKGVVGLQVENFDFSALGDEAFVPTTDTRRRALFVVEEAATPIGTWSGGVRLERVHVGSAGDADPADARFGPPASRAFTLRSASIGNTYALGSGWHLTGSFSSTARAPTSFELFANGVHAATGAYERGDASLGIERGNNLDLALQWKNGDDHLRLGAYAARFARFISLETSGGTIDRPNQDGGVDSFPEYVFRAVRARLEGVEIEGGHRAVTGGWTLATTAKLDYTRATNRDTGEPLPRIAPLRLTLGLDAGTGPWLGRVELELADRQTRVPADDRETAGYGLLNLALSRHVAVFGTDAFWYVKATNLADKLAYSASAVATVRGLSPLAGRAVSAGLRVTF